jgi:hypothetical protein
MVSKQPGTMDLGVIDARRRANNPLVRNQRRKNKKPRKAPVSQGQGPSPRITVPLSGRLTPNRSLDERVMRMRESAAAPTASPEEPSSLDYLPPFDSLDHATQAQIRGFIFREVVRHPELFEGAT